MKEKIKNECKELGLYIKSLILEDIIEDLKATRLNPSKIGEIIIILQGLGMSIEARQLQKEVFQYYKDFQQLLKH